MTITFTLEQAAWAVIFILAAVLLIHVILLLRKVIDTLKVVDTLLADAKSVTEVASRRTNDIDHMVDGIVDAAGIMTDAVKGNQNIAKAASSIVNATASCVGIIKGKKSDDEASK